MSTKPTQLESISSELLTACRLCGGELDQVLGLMPTPPANDLLTNAEDSLAQPRFPLEVMLCQACGHLQLHHEVSREALFNDYLYRTGVSESFRRHFEAYAQRMVQRSYLRRGDLVVDIGSNDGTLLDAFQAQEQVVVGVEPAWELAAETSRRGIPTYSRFFDSATATEIAERFGRARLITANNVFAHVGDIHEFVAGVKRLLDPGGNFVFEVSYALDVLRKGLFDTIYHEHLDYHSVASLARFFESLGLQLFDVERVSTHGGSIRCYVSAATRHRGDKVSELIRQEAVAGLHDRQPWADLQEQIRFMHEAWQIGEAGLGRFCGYGAAAKATTLIHQLRPREMEFVVDDSPFKQGRYVPGTSIPIVPAERLYDSGLQVCLILAWNVAEDIKARHPQAPVRFILPPWQHANS